MQDRVGKKSGPLHAQPERPAGHGAGNPGDQREPPPVGRGRMRLPPERRILVVDAPHAPVPARQHELGLLDPLVGRVVVLRHDQPPLAVGIAGRRAWFYQGIPRGEVRYELDALQPRAVRPYCERERASRSQYPSPGRKPRKEAHGCARIGRGVGLPWIKEKVNRADIRGNPTAWQEGAPRTGPGGTVKFLEATSPRPTNCVAKCHQTNTSAGGIARACGGRLAADRTTVNRKSFIKTLAAGGAVLIGRPLSLIGGTAPVPTGPPPRAGEPGSAGAIAEQPLAPRLGRRGATMFKALPAQETGVVTENPYDDPRMWGALYYQSENGSFGTGVAIGDYDGDGRPDIFVVSKTRSCRLFRNLGNWRFEDVTDRAGVGDKGESAEIWKHGATFVDVDNNGLLDIYVCRFGAPNLLYINQGDGTFREEAQARGLAVRDASVMAAFCDYDRDGFLDVFVQTNLLDASHPNGQRDYLFHNNGDGTFSDVTGRAGIGGEAQGHSCVWWDYDGDGWPDLYVANDFAAPDKLYHNNRDGTFTDTIDSVVPHMPYSSMGSDLGDV